jgi:hypothetical protein
VSAGEGCRAGAHSAKAGFNVRMGRLWFGRPFHCGKLDQSTERSLINFFRWVRLPLPLPIFREAIQLSDCKSDVAK